MTAYLLLITTVIAVVLIRESTGRELRPSDHGLEYQSLPPTGLKSAEMKSFFGATSKSSSKPSTVALPKVMNSNDSWWWRGKRQVLLLGSFICGVTGVALLAASAIIYVIKIRSSSPPTKSMTTA
ncbi:hypothetical protein V6N13_130322 [Hibiscus sabdariffa]|uniref:Uncharacterized protein n=1 Tax=Hibiscus sabdariffa TaxID=183260 RepID=A0ABR2AQV7_9ROSI